jgi:hypothetical protein
MSVFILAAPPSSIVMGKQSRRRGAVVGKNNDKAAAKQAHKERQAERQQTRVLQAQQQQPPTQQGDSDHGSKGGLSDNNPEENRYTWHELHGPKRLDRWTILKGDVVWFRDTTETRRSFDSRNPDSYRGIVVEFGGIKSRILTATIEYYVIRPFYPDGDNEVRAIHPRNVRRDVEGWHTLPYAVGDKVVCCNEASSSSFYATVTCHWPIWKIWDDKDDWTRDAVPAYGVVRDDDKEVILVYSSLELTKYDPTNRYQIGDRILLDPTKADWLKWRCKTRSDDQALSSWMEGVVTAVDVIKQHYSYHIVYECSVLVDGKARQCHVSIDNDEHITTASPRSARDRLINSIKQGCSFGHISRLIAESKLDVSTIETLVLSLAIEHGSYDMLYWMDKNLSLPLTRIENDDGDLLQHQIVRSPNVVKFMERLQVAPESMSLSVFEPENKPWCVNKKHETWVDILIQAGNCRALELLLHTDESVDLYGKALCWVIGWDLSKILESSLATKIPGQNRLMRRIIDDHLKAMTTQQQRRAMAHYISNRLIDFMAQPFMQEFAAAKDDITDILRLVRYGRQTKHFIDDIIKMGRYGFDEVFRRFYDLNACRTSILRWTSSWRLPETQNKLV